MKFAVENKDLLTHKYIAEKKSIRQLAEEFGTYPNKILRALNFLNVEVRDKSEATKNAISEGRKIPPTTGVERTKEEKIKISDGRAAAWNRLTKCEKENISNQSRLRWEAISADKKEEIRKLSHEAIRRTSKEGSGLEKFIHRSLIENGYDCFHHSKILVNNKLEVDLFIPKLSIAIEIDGPSHFLPIWGEESLQRHVKADKQKNGLLTMNGIVTCRVKYVKRSLSGKSKRDVLRKLLSTIKEIELDKTPRVIYLEVE